MTVWIDVLFSDGGIPKEGLTPLVKIYRMHDNIEVVTADIMPEIGSGKYKYPFEAESGIDYSILADGGATLTNFERYKEGNIDGFLTSINADINILIGVNQRPASARFS